jgi:hypothetical protein
MPLKFYPSAIRWGKKPYPDVGCVASSFTSAFGMPSKWSWSYQQATEIHLLFPPPTPTSSPFHLPLLTPLLVIETLHDLDALD